MLSMASSTRAVRRLLLLTDAAAVLAAIALAVLERPYLARLLPLEALPPVDARLPELALIAFLALPLWLSLAARLGLHQLFERAWTLSQLTWELCKLHVLGFLVLAAMIYATQVVLNRSLVALFLLNSFCSMLAYRALLAHRRRVLHRRGVARTRLLLVGSPNGTFEHFVRVAAAEDYPPEMVGYLGADRPAKDATASDEHPSPRRLGGLDDIERILHREPIDQVLFFAPYDRPQAIEGALLACETVGVPALLAVDFGSPSDAPPQLAQLHGRPFVSLDSAPKRADLLAVKHGFDTLAAILGLLIVSPLLLLAGLAILVTMGRPILFVQERAGYRGRPFRMLKLRTMTVDAEARQAELQALNEVDGAAFKLRDDPRVTRLGRFLRRTSIDELPQLLNVAAGTMSLVGPRPLPLCEQQQLRGWHRRRLSVKPGISGLWQISGRSDLDFADWMALDIRYVDEWSLWLDLKILLKTVPVVLLQRGAR